MTGAPAVTAQPSRASPVGRLFAVNFAACLLLLIQYLLGMAVNLYVTVPAGIPGQRQQLPQRPGIGPRLGDS